jgi:hypothetical protein
MTLPEVTISAEIPVKDWLCLRAGLGKQYITHTNIVGDITTTNKDAEGDDNFLTLGTGFTFAGFKLDCSVQDNIFFQGPYIFGGVPENIAAQVSLCYEW